MSQHRKPCSRIVSDGGRASSRGRIVDRTSLGGRSQIVKPARPRQHARIVNEPEPSPGQQGGAHKPTLTRREICEALMAQPTDAPTTLGDVNEELGALSATLAEAEARAKAEAKERARIKRICQFNAGLGVLKRIITKIRAGMTRELFNQLQAQLIKLANLDPNSRGKQFLLKRWEFVEEERELRRIYCVSKERGKPRFYVGGQWHTIDMKSVGCHDFHAQLSQSRPVGGQASEWFQFDELDDDECQEITGEEVEDSIGERFFQAILSSSSWEPLTTADEIRFHNKLFGTEYSIPQELDQE